MAASQSSLNDVSTSTNGSENAKRPGSLQITPSELNRPANLQRIAQRKAQIKTYPTRKKLEKLGVYSSCKVMFRMKERRRKKLDLFFLVNVKFGATTEYPSIIVFLKRHPWKNEAYLFICKLVNGYSEV